MRIKTLFSVPDGEKVTEKAFRKVLISSICSILLCMTCLVSTTWAWFTVSIHNSGNEIVIAKITPVVTIRGDTTVEPSNGSYTLAKDTEYSVTVNLTKEDTSTEVLEGKSAPVYLVITVMKAGVPKDYYIEVGNNTLPIEQNITVGGDTVSVSFAASWAPKGTKIENNVLMIGEIPTETITKSTSESTGETTVETIVETTTEPAAAPSSEPASQSATESNT